MSGRRVYIPRTEWGPSGNDRTITLPDGCSGVLFVFTDREHAEKFNCSAQPMMAFSDRASENIGERRDTAGNITKAAP